MGINLNEGAGEYFMAPGEHVATVDECEEREHADGRKYWWFLCLNKQGERVYHSILRTKKTTRVLRSFAIACGFSRDELGDVEPKSFQGRQVRLEVEENSDGYPVIKKWRSTWSPNKDEQGESQQERRDLF